MYTSICLGYILKLLQKKVHFCAHSVRKNGLNCYIKSPFLATPMENGGQFSKFPTNSGGLPFFHFAEYCLDF